MTQPAEPSQLLDPVFLSSKRPCLQIGKIDASTGCASAKLNKTCEGTSNNNIGDDDVLQFLFRLGGCWMGA